ncbi:hypothetical protein NXU84_22935 [Parabacteroides distasonis]|nr:hypothetical protein [Parabacteroides distasonis]
MENNISQKHIKMENKKAVKLTDFQKNEENPFMKQAIEGIERRKSFYETSYRRY